MGDLDELDFNPMFKALQGKFLSNYEVAQEHCHVICIPSTDCLQGVSINKKFIDTHILKASPLFKGLYQTVNSSKQTVSISEGNDYLVLEEGFPTTDKIRIINEELGYNKDYKPYKILVIERPLDTTVVRTNALDELSLSEEFKPKTSLQECKDFLLSYPEYSKALKELDENIEKFNRNYMILNDYLEDAADRLHQISSAATEVGSAVTLKCVKCSKHKHGTNAKYKDILSSTIEMYTVAGVHQKVFRAVCDKWRRQDDRLVSHCQKLTGLTADLLGVSHYFACPLPSAVVELAHLDSLKTPTEKLYCLKTTFDNITADIDNNLKELHSPDITNEDIPCLTSDDLIPILVTVIIQAKCRHIHSNIFYMENFYWSAGTKDRDNLSYCLVTFKAAIQYMTSTNFDKLDLSKNLVENEISIDDLMAAKWEKSISPTLEEDHSIDNLSSRPRAQSKNRLEHRLDSITKMLEESAKELTTSPREIPDVQATTSIFGQHTYPTLNTESLQTENQKKKKEQMGEFLSQLQDDFFMSYGKQT